ncbi:MAG: PHP domain-containing protein, partial [Pseudomonadota bacterium]|nr:PHP domain-containing protein [Pseudomonadota bacterium]
MPLRIFRHDEIPERRADEFLVRHFQQHREGRVAVSDRAVVQQRRRALLHLFDDEPVRAIRTFERINLLTQFAVDHEGIDGAGLRADPATRVPFAELHCHSNFSFLDGASHPEELVEAAAGLGLDALALTDHDGMYGVVRFAEAAAELDVPTAFGSELSLGLSAPQN